MQDPKAERSTIQLAQFLKVQGLVSTGGEAKILIQRGDVRVNGAIETRRARQLQAGDQVELGGCLRVVPPMQEQS